MNQIGIICASDTELAPFLRRMESPCITEKAMLKFYASEFGGLNGLRVIAGYSGVCKVNAAIAAQILIDVFQADCIISAGTAGGMNKNTKCFYTVIARRLVYHDVADDILTEFHPWLSENCFHADTRLLAAAEQYAKNSAHPVLFGTVATGESFVTNEMRKKINAKHAPLAVDMESAALAHVCHANDIPFLSVRTLTDTPAEDGMETFEKNCAAASEISAEIVLGILAHYVQKGECAD